MRIRDLAVAAVALATLATGSPASAEQVQVLAGYNNGLAGTIAAEATAEEGAEGTDAPGGGKYHVIADCTFAGVLTPNNSLIVEFWGTANSSADDVTRVPQITFINCEITNGIDTTSTDILLNGNTSATAGSTLLSVDGAKEWAVLPITVCTSAYALFGNIDPKLVRLRRTCKTPDGTASAA